MNCSFEFGPFKQFLFLDFARVLQPHSPAGKRGLRGARWLELAQKWKPLKLDDLEAKLEMPWPGPEGIGESLLGCPIRSEKGCFLHKLYGLNQPNRLMTCTRVQSSELLITDLNYFIINKIKLNWTRRKGAPQLGHPAAGCQLSSVSFGGALRFEKRAHLNSSKETRFKSVSLRQIKANKGNDLLSSATAALKELLSSGKKEPNDSFTSPSLDLVLKATRSFSLLSSS